MTGPIFMAAIFVFMGIYFVAYNIVQGYPYFAAALSGMSFILLLIIPVLTMRSFAEERRSKTDQLLLTSPVSVTQIVMGKYLAMVSVLGFCMIISCLAPIIIHFYGEDIGSRRITRRFSDFFSWEPPISPSECLSPR